MAEDTPFVPGRELARASAKIAALDPLADAGDSLVDDSPSTHLPPVDPVEDLTKAAPAPQEAAPAVAEPQATVDAVDLLNAIGTARHAFAEILALSSSPSVNTAQLGAIAERALKALPVT